MAYVFESLIIYFLFFKDVYPLQYGVKFSAALQKLMWLLLSRLQNALPQPTIEEVNVFLVVSSHISFMAYSVLIRQIQSKFKPLFKLLDGLVI